MDKRRYSLGIASAILPILLWTDATAGPVRFLDVTREAGLDYIHHADPQKKHIIDSMGGGVAFFDFDRDGWLDIYFVGTLTLTMLRENDLSKSRLYRNNRDGTFADVTAASGLAAPGWGMGASAGDFDGDGWVDLYVTCLGPNRLFRNNGDGTFTDVAERAGVADRRWSAGAGFADYDRDGDLDLFVANYTDATLETLSQFGDKAHCQFRGIPIQCDPRVYRGAGDALYRNRGDGTFEDVSLKAGVSDPDQYFGLGVLWLDVDDDGYPDLYVANDSRPNYLYRNNRDGTFSEIAFESGTAVAEEGTELGSMGLSAADYDRDGRIDILVTNYAYEHNSLYHQDDPLLFSDMSIAAGIADSSLFLMGWGADFLDFDNDGWLDLAVVDGHLYPQVEALPGVGQRVAAFSMAVQVSYRQPKLFYRNTGDGVMKMVSEELGPALVEARVSRGLAVGDYDNDGDPDIVVNDLDGPPMLLRNEGGSSAGNWLRVTLEGSGKNRSAIGARVRVVTGKVVQQLYVRSGASYLSQGDFRLHFGLGKAKTVDLVEVFWPDGTATSRKSVQPNRELVIRQDDK